MPDDNFIMYLRDQRTRLIRLREQTETGVFAISDKSPARRHADVDGHACATQRAIESIELAIRDYEINHT